MACKPDLIIFCYDVLSFMIMFFCLYVSPGIRSELVECVVADIRLSGLQSTYRDGT